MKVFDTAKVFVGGLRVEDELRENERSGHIGDGVLLYVEELNLGEGAQINAGAKVVGGGKFSLGRYSTVSYNAVILTGVDVGKLMNDYAPENLRKVIRGEVWIGHGCLIGAGAVICVSEKHPLIEIGDGAVVMANSYIDEDVPENTIFGHFGPYKVKKTREP